MFFHLCYFVLLISTIILNIFVLLNECLQTFKWWRTVNLVNEWRLTFTWSLKGQHYNWAQGGNKVLVTDAPTSTVMKRGQRVIPIVLPLLHKYFTPCESHLSELRTRWLKVSSGRGRRLTDMHKIPGPPNKSHSSRVEDKSAPLVSSCAARSIKTLESLQWQRLGAADNVRHCSLNHCGKDERVRKWLVRRGRGSPLWRSPGPYSNMKQDFK